MITGSDGVGDDNDISVKMILNIDMNRISSKKNIKTKTHLPQNAAFSKYCIN